MNVGWGFVFLVFFLFQGCTKSEKQAATSLGVTSDPTPNQTKLLDCSDSSIKLKKSDGTISTIDTLQSAIDQADAGSFIDVGSMAINNGITISKKRGLAISTQCLSSIKSISIVDSSNITVDGFLIEPSGLLKPGIDIASEVEEHVATLSKTKDGKDKEDSDANKGKDASQNNAGNSANSANGNNQTASNGNSQEPKKDDAKDSKDKHDEVANNTDESNDADDDHEVKTSNITIRNCRIQRSDLGYPGIKVHGGVGSLNLINNYIFENGADGINFSDSSKGGPHLVEKNIISYNTKNGIVIPKKQKITLKENLIVANGTGADGGYGIKRNGNAEFSPTNTTLIGNIIAFNHGKVNKDKSSQDISFYAGILDSTDNGNKTTTGTEGIGIIKLEDTTAPKIHLVNQDNQRTNKPTYWIEAVVEDSSPIETQVFHNGALVLTTKQFLFEKQVTIAEGVNTFQIVSKDVFGNSSTSALTSIILDTIPPKIAADYPPPGSTFYTNKYPFTFKTGWHSDELLSLAHIQSGIASLEADVVHFSKDVVLSQEGNFTIPVDASDLVANTSQSELSGNLVFDNIAPEVTVTIAGNYRTKETTIMVPVEVRESSPSWTAIYINDEKLFETAALSFTAPVILPSEGMNSFKIIATDAAGNVSQAITRNIIRDTTPPVILNVTPQNGITNYGQEIAIEINFNEAIQTATVNGIALTLSQGGSNASGTYISSTEGAVLLLIAATDLAGNTVNKEISINVESRLLVKELITVSPAPDGYHLIILGAKSAAKPNIAIQAKGGIWFINSTSTISDSDGSFEMILNPFKDVTLSASDPKTGKSESVSLSFQLDTTLSGIIKDALTGFPLMGVTVKIEGTPLVTQSDANGGFSFATPPNGDQVIVFDGASIPENIRTSSRQYGITKATVSIGLVQRNILDNPIFMTPLLLDGNEKTVVKDVPTVVESTDIPGVRLEIPANTAIFPSSSNTTEFQNKISLALVPSSNTSVQPPDFAKPSFVLSMEPSGLNFTEPVPLTLPNDYELDPGVELVLLSMNSQKGIWEIDGAAQVADDGKAITTKPGQGITHFSQVYAVPLPPVIKAFGENSSGVINADLGALKREIQLPTYQVLGKKVKNTLLYNSNWAKPNVVFSDYIHIPKRTVEVKYVTRTSSQSFRPTTQCYEGIANTDPCIDNWYAYQEVALINNNVKAWYIPQFINVQFNLGDFAGFTNASAVTSGIMTKTGSDITAALPADSIVDYWTPKGVYKGIPSHSIISMGYELKGPDGRYIKTGLYPTSSRYEIGIKNITMSTKSVYPYEKGKVGALISSETTWKENLESSLFKQVRSNLVYVENQVESPAGRGWKIGGVQRIINTDGSRVAVDEGDGNVTLYGINNTIETVLNANDTNVKGDLTKAVDLSQWPIATYTNQISVGGSKTQPPDNILTQVVNVNLSDTNKYSIALSQIPGINGQFDAFYSLTGKFLPPNYVLACNPKKWMQSIRYLIPRPLTAVISMGGNDWFGADGFYGSILGQSSGAGFLETRQVTQQQRVGDYQLDVYDFCSNVGAICAPIGTACINADGKKYNYINMPYETELSFMSLKNASSIIRTPDGHLAVADTGHNSVKKIYLYDSFSPSVPKVTLLAGNWQTYDSGDGTTATQASVYHPRGLVYDKSGNLYISTERGLIRKVDVNGIISTFAGNPEGKIGNNGEVPALDLLLINPYGMVIDEDRRLFYVADTGNNRVVQINLDTMMAKSVAGSGINDGNCSSSDSVGDGSPAILSDICRPTQVGLDDVGNLLIADSGHNRIRRVLFQNTSQTESFYSLANGEVSSALGKHADGTWLRKYRNGLQIEFDSFGRQNKVRDLIGNTREIRYNGNGQPEKIIEPTGEFVTFNYSFDGALKSVRDIAGRETVLMQTNGYLDKVWYPDNSSVSFGYRNDLLFSETNQNGKTTSYYYNQHLRLNRIVKPDQSEITVSSIEDQGAGDNSTADNPVDLQSITGGQRNFMIDARGNEVSSISNYQGLPTSVTDATGKITFFKRDQFGKILEIRNPNGTTTNYSYSPNTNDLVKIEYSNGTPTKQFEYDQFGNIVKETTGSLVVTRAFSSTTGLLMSETTPSGVVTTYTYGIYGLPAQVISRSSGLTVTETRSYDPLGHLSSVTTSTGENVSFSYDLAGNIIDRSIKQSASTISTKYEYDVFNRLKKVTTPKQEVTAYSYLPEGQLETITDPKGNISYFSYNDVGLLIKKIEPLGGIYEFDYDRNGNKTLEKDPNGNVKVFNYDKLNRLSESTLPDQLIKYEYNQNGKISRITNNISDIIMDYDDRNRVDSVVFSGVGSISNSPTIGINYGYDTNDNLKTMTTALGTTTYNYDVLNRLSDLTNRFGQSFGFNFDEDNRLKYQTRPNGRTDYAYNTKGQLEGITHRASSTTLAAFNYLYDERNLIMQKRTLAGEFNYTYDDNAQLASASNPTHSLEQYTYDPLGNRITDQIGSYVYDDKAQQLKEDYQYKYFYDANGNLTQKLPKDLATKGFVYNYSSTNQLVEMSITDGATGPRIVQIKYIYDALGKRIQKQFIDYQDSTKSYTRKYVYDGENVLFEYDSNNSLIAEYTHSPLRPDDILAVNVTSDGVVADIAKTQGSYFYLKDHLGSVTEITNENGAVVQKYDYSSFGKIYSITDGAGGDITSSPVLRTTYTYTGREYEEESGLFYYRARFYDPGVGRFLQQDQDPGKLHSPMTHINKYSYVGNQPTRLIDPTGKFWWLVAFALVGAVNGYRAGQIAGLKGWDLFGSTLLGSVTTAASPWVGATYGIGWGLFASTLAGGIFQAGMQKLAYGKIIDWVNVNAAAGVGFIGGALGVGAASAGYSFGLTLKAASLLDKSISLGLGATGLEFGVPTPTEDEIKQYRETHDVYNYPVF